MRKDISYKVIEWELDILDPLIRPVEKIVDGKLVGFIDRLKAGYGVEHGSDNDVRVEDCQVERWFVLVHEVPCSFFGVLL